MAKAVRLSAEKRRQSILMASVPLFARFGFNGTTTRMIARAAGISEALLYRHFPSKEMIYEDLKDYCCQGKTQTTEMMATLKPSTSTLVHAIYFLIHHIAEGMGHDERSGVRHNDMHRLMANSYLEDGLFARIITEQSVTTWQELLNQCAEEAIKAGDMLEDWIDLRCRWWFSHHIAVALGFLNLPEEKIIDYGLDFDQVLDQAVRFALRGMGLTDQAIKTHYNPAMLALLAGANRENNNDK